MEWRFPIAFRCVAVYIDLHVTEIQQKHVINRVTHMHIELQKINTSPQNVLLRVARAVTFQRLKEVSANTISPSLSIFSQNPGIAMIDKNDILDLRAVGFLL